MSRMAPPIPPRPSVMARSIPPVETVKMVMSLEALTFEDLVEGELGEGIAAGGDEDDVLAAFDAAQAVKRFVESVEEIGSLKPGIWSILMAWRS
jgi:hypothetical protein